MLHQVVLTLLTDWPMIINAHDGLITANQLLTGSCEACETRTCKKPILENFLLLSLQPEHNIQVLATKGTYLLVCLIAKVVRFLYAFLC